MQLIQSIFLVLLVFLTLFQIILTAKAPYITNVPPLTSINNNSFTIFGTDFGLPISTSFIIINNKIVPNSDIISYQDSKIIVNNSFPKTIARNATFQVIVYNMISNIYILKLGPIIDYINNKVACVDDGNITIKGLYLFQEGEYLPTIKFGSSSCTNYKVIRKDDTLQIVSCIINVNETYAQVPISFGEDISDYNFNFIPCIKSFTVDKQMVTLYGYFLSSLLENITVFLGDKNFTTSPNLLANQLGTLTFKIPTEFYSGDMYIVVGPYSTSNKLNVQIFPVIENVISRVSTDGGHITITGSFYTANISTSLMKITDPNGIEICFDARYSISIITGPNIICYMKAGSGGNHTIKVNIGGKESNYYNPVFYEEPSVTQFGIEESNNIPSEPFIGYAIGKNFGHYASKVQIEFKSPLNEKNLTVLSVDTTKIRFTVPINSFSDPMIITVDGITIVTEISLMLYPSIKAITVSNTRNKTITIYTGFIRSQYFDNENRPLEELQSNISVFASNDLVKTIHLSNDLSTITGPLDRWSGENLPIVVYLKKEDTRYTEDYTNLLKFRVPNAVEFSFPPPHILYASRADEFGGNVTIIGQNFGIPCTITINDTPCVVLYLGVFLGEKIFRDIIVCDMAPYNKSTTPIDGNAYPIILTINKQTTTKNAFFYRTPYIPAPKDHISKFAIAAVVILPVLIVVTCMINFKKSREILELKRNQEEIGVNIGGIIMWDTIVRAKTTTAKYINNNVMLDKIYIFRENTNIDTNIGTPNDTENPIIDAATNSNANISDITDTNSNATYDSNSSTSDDENMKIPF